IRQLVAVSESVVSAYPLRAKSLAWSISSVGVLGFGFWITKPAQDRPLFGLTDRALCAGLFPDPS
ncbi:MAG: hypothetical protein ACRERU_19925, partial [Methylococcales bacterium]